MAETPAKTAPKAPARQYNDPFSAFRAEMDRVFENFFPGGGLMPQPKFTLLSESGGMVVPTVDVKENDKTITITAELPGLSEKEVEIVLRDGVLTLKGEKREEKSEEKEDYHLTERRYGHFQRSFRVPDSVDQEAIKADFDKGVLKIEMPKTKEARKNERKIKIG